MNRQKHAAQRTKLKETNGKEKKRENNDKGNINKKIKTIGKVT